MKSRDRKSLEASILKEAESLLSEGVTAVAFSDRFFGPKGRILELWKTNKERAEVAASDLFKTLQTQLAGLRRTEAEAFNKEVDQYSGRLTVVVPKSLHAALRSEAAMEGISLAELIRLKLGISYRMFARLMASGGELPPLKQH